MTKAKEYQLNFWNKFDQYLKEQNSFLKCIGNPQPLSWHAFSIGASEVYLEAVINSRGKIRTEKKVLKHSKNSIILKKSMEKKRQ